METAEKQKNKEEAKAKYKERRAALIELSKLAQTMQKAGDERTVNQIVLEEFYTDDENSEFHLFRQWKENGFKIKKGSKAFTIWGKKRKVEADPEAKSEEEKGYKFFPLAYLFSNAQVEQA